MRKNSDIIRTIVEVAIFAALGFVFDELQGAVAKAIFPTGGSIGFALIAVVIVSYRRGPIAGFFTGLIMGGLDFLTGPYILNFWQVLLDYIFPYSVVAICGFFKPLFDNATIKRNKIIILLLGTLIGGLAKFTCHFLSGGIFFADYITWVEFKGQPWLYSLAYNMAAVGPSIVLTMILLVALYLRAPKVLEAPKVEVEKQEYNIRFFDYGVNAVMAVSGIFLFIFFLIKYIESYYFEDYGDSFELSFDQDALMLFITGLLLMFTTLNTILKTVVKRQNYRLTTVVFTALSFANIVYPIARMIRLSIKGKDINVYFIWMGVAVLITSLLVGLYQYLKKAPRTEEPKISD